MRVLIFGASGRTGQLLVKRALRRAHVVTAFMRSPADFGIAAANLAVFTGNVSDRAAIGRAMKGQEAVISVLGASRPGQRNPALVAGVGDILDLMRQGGVRRLIYQSCFGVGDSGARAGAVTRLIVGRGRAGELADHAEAEALIRASGLHWTILRPPTLTNGAATGRCQAGEAVVPRGLRPTVSRADVASFLAGQLEDAGFVGKVVGLA